MASLFSKDDDLRKSAPYIGYEILKLLRTKQDSRISIFDIANSLKKANNLSIRSVYYGMIFLHTLNIIDFEAPYIVEKC